jgi:cytosine/adenosine deaminase-related metal-dependent hydrolase
MSKIRLHLIPLAAALTLASCAPGEPPADLAIQNVTVIDAANGAREALTVLVSDGRITAVQAADESVTATEVVDGSGQYLIPGLWDFHVHLTYDARFTEAMPGLFLNHGITSIRDTGGPLELVLPAVEAIRAEGATAPRVFFAGPLLDGEHVVYDGENNPLLGIANPDAETARANMARLAEAGVDFVKIYEMVSPEVFAVLVEEAQARGLPMDGHVPLSMQARDVGPHVQSLEHLRNIEMDCTADPEAAVAERRGLLANPDGLAGGPLRSQLHRAYRIPSVEAYDEAACREVLASMMSTIQVPTLRLNALSLHPPQTRSDWREVLDKLPEDVAADWGAGGGGLGGRSADPTFPNWSLFLVGLMHQAGVPIGAGTDTPIASAAPGYSLHSELEMLVRAGLSPIEALRAATLRPAEFFGLEGEMGTIEPGRLADLVLLAGNPLDDITQTRSVLAVVTKGQLLDRSELDALVR